MLVLIDNYDSFTYNLVQKLGEVGGSSLKMEVFRNDKVTADQVEDLKPTHIVISPGPCTPREGGVSNVQVVKEEKADDQDLTKLGNESPIIRFVNYLIFDAV